MTSYQRLGFEIAHWVGLPGSLEQRCVAPCNVAFKDTYYRWLALIQPATKNAPYLVFGISPEFALVY